MNKSVSIILGCIIIIAKFNTVFAQHYKIHRLDYSLRSKPQEITIKSDIDGLVFDIWWTDEKSKMIIVDDSQKLRNSNKIKQEHPDMLCYLKIDIPDYGNSPVYVEGKVIETGFSAGLGKPAKTANITMDKFVFDIKFLNVVSDLNIECTIVPKPEINLTNVVDFKYKILKISSEPIGADIYLKSKKTDRITPAEFKGLKDDTVLVQLQKSGYQDTNFVVVLLNDETISLIS